MSVFEIMVGVAFWADVFLGVSVLKTNPARTVNQVYAILCAVLGVWLLSVGFVLRTTVASNAEMGIRVASISAFFFFSMCHLLRICIRTKPRGLLQPMLKTKWHLFAGLLFSGLVMTDFYMDGVTLPDGPGVAEPHYGPGFVLMNAYFVAVMLALVIGLVVDIRRSVGMQRLELQYVAVGSVFAGGFGGILALVIPLLSHSSQTAPLAPLGVIVFDVIVAYGIARGRIMDVSDVLQRSVGAVFLVASMGAVYGLSWMLLNWILTVSCGLPEAIPYFCASLISMLTLSVLRSRVRGWVDLLFSEKKGSSVVDVLEQVARDLQNVTTMDKLLEQFMAWGPPVVGATQAEMFVADKGRYCCVTDGKIVDVLSFGGPIEDLIQKERIPLILENVERQQQTPERAGFCTRMRELGCHAAIGIFSSRRLEGILLLGPRTRGLVYSYIELDALQLLCNQLAVSLENASLYTEVQNARIYNEILLDQLVTGVVAADATGRITFFNCEAQRITGQPDLKDRSVSRLPQTLQEHWRNAVESGIETRDADLNLVVDEQVRVPVRLSSAPFRSAQGEVLGALLLFHDMTAMKAMEAKIRRADRLMSVGTLAAGMAHEIKNPLVSIKTFSQLLPERYEDPDFRNTFSELMGQEVGRIDGIVNQLLRFARPEKPRLEPMRMHEVLGKSVPLVKEQLKRRGLHLELKLNAANDLIQGDASLLHQVFVNFYLNAIDAMNEGGMLTIRTHNASQALLFESVETDTSWIRVEVLDTGKGIDREDLQKIFDPFYTSKSEGTGLGLSVAYNIVQEHGGTIDVSSKLGEGTTFSILLPVSKEPCAS